MMGFDWVLVVGWVGREMGLVVIWLVWRPPVRPGHTPLASLRSLAPLSRCERGGCAVCGDGVVAVWLAGAGLKPAPTGWSMVGLR